MGSKSRTNIRETTTSREVEADEVSQHESVILIEVSDSS